jgi:uncharacterized protein
MRRDMNSYSATLPGLPADENVPLSRVLFRLGELKTELRRRGVRHLAVFGSVARGEAGPTSDIDLIAELDPGAHIDIFDWVSISVLISDHIGQPIDLVRRQKLRPEVAAAAARDEIHAF